MLDILPPKNEIKEDQGRIRREKRKKRKKRKRKEEKRREKAKNEFGTAYNICKSVFWPNWSRYYSILGVMSGPRMT